MTQISANYQNDLQTSSSSVLGKGSADSKTERSEADSKESQSIYGGNLNFAQDLIAQKKALAGKQALKGIMDVYSGTQKVDAEIENRKKHIQELEAEMKESQGWLSDIADRKSALMETYQMEPDSQEELDLQLYQKEADAMKSGRQVTFTEEEAARLKKMHEEGLTEYQQQGMELYKQQKYFEGKIEDADKERKIDTGVIRGIHEERLKHHDMIDAQKAADTILENASREAIGMLIDESSDTQEQKLEDIKEAAQEKREKEQSQNPDETQPEQPKEVEHQQEILSAAANQMVAEKKITEEDVKGLIYDEVL